MTPLLFCLLLGASQPALAAGRAAAVDAARDLDSHIAAARLFVKKGWYTDARSELSDAIELPGAESSFELHWLWANVAWELLLTEEAAEMARIAARLAPDEGRASSARQMVALAGDGMGTLVVEGPQEGMSTRLQLELPAVIFDPALKQYSERVAARLREKTPLPLRVSLPPGNYAINGKPATLSAGTQTTLHLPISAMGSRGFAALQVSRIELSGGVSILSGKELSGVPVVPTAELAFTQPLGPLLVGLLGEVGRAGGLTPGGLEVEPQTQWSAGLRVGADIPSRVPLAIRPSLLLRGGTQFGLPLACDAAGCSLDEADPTAILTVGRLLAVGGELSIDYRRPGHAAALGSGLKVAVDQAFGRVSSEGETEEVSWNGTGARVLANLTVAF